VNLTPAVVGKEFIVLRATEATDPSLLTDGQLLAQLTEAEREQATFGEDASDGTRIRLATILEEVRRRCLVAATNR
jgi:hypothetical protein